MKTKVEVPEVSEHDQCVAELNVILTKYNYALVPYVEPRFKLVKVEKKDEPAEPAN